MTLTREDCLQYLGEDGFRLFLFARKHGQRIGQAWMNSLTSDDYRKLTGTLYDPFYRDDWQSLILALQFLLEN
jgi:hypothetical protein